MFPPYIELLRIIANFSNNWYQSGLNFIRKSINLECDSNCIIEWHNNYWYMRCMFCLIVMLMNESSIGIGR